MSVGGAWIGAPRLGCRGLGAQIEAPRWGRPDGGVPREGCLDGGTHKGAVGGARIGVHGWGVSPIGRLGWSTQIWVTGWGCQVGGVRRRVPFPPLPTPLPTPACGHPVANVALPVPQMEVEKPPLGPEPPTLLKTYKWRTAAPMGDREAERGTGSPGSRRWTRLQGWKRSYSQPESDGPDDGAGKGSASSGAPKASTRRSLFQRAFSAPSKGTKETRGPEGGKATLQKYLRSMSKRKGHVESGARAEQVPHDAVPGRG